MTSQQQAAPYPRVVIAAPQGRSGKTTLSLGICAALAAQGLRVQPFKKGPDYIDPSWLSAAAGAPCRALDPFFLPDPAALQAAFVAGAAQADFTLVEGNHGLYDGLPVEGAGQEADAGFSAGSTAAVAQVLQAPVILVVNTARMGRSVAALALGYANFEPQTNLAGIVLNNVAQARHEAKLRQALEIYTDLPVLGAIPRAAQLTIPDRHLGLIPQAEDERLVPAIAACRQVVEQHVNLEQVLAVARSAPPLAPPWESARPAPSAARPRLGVIRDRAFTFYYPENLAALEAAGAELVFFEALSAPALPPVDGLYIGGGFPELFLPELSANASLRAEIRQAIERGLPVYAECGGLMYLSRAIHWEGQSAEMVGALPCEAVLHARPQGHGYVAAEVDQPNPILPVGARLRGHEFHHSQLVGLPGDLPSAYRLSRGTGIGGGRDGLVYHNVLAAYTHLHAGGSPAWAPALVQRARDYAARETHV